MDRYLVTYSHENSDIVRTMEVSAPDYTKAYLEATYSLPLKSNIINLTKAYKEIYRL